jgi:hypothetical protein
MAEFLRSISTGIISSITTVTLTVLIMGAFVARVIDYIMFKDSGVCFAALFALTFMLSLSINVVSIKILESLRVSVREH